MTPAPSPYGETPSASTEHAATKQITNTPGAAPEQTTFSESPTSHESQSTPLAGTRTGTVQPPHTFRSTPTTLTYHRINRHTAWCCCIRISVSGYLTSSTPSATTLTPPAQKRHKQATSFFSHFSNHISQPPTTHNCHLTKHINVSLHTTLL